LETELLAAIAALAAVLATSALGAEVGRPWRTRVLRHGCLLHAPRAASLTPPWAGVEPATGAGGAASSPAYSPVPRSRGLPNMTLFRSAGAALLMLAGMAAWATPAPVWFVVAGTRP